jgi:hypothetical protein
MAAPTTKNDSRKDTQYGMEGKPRAHLHHLLEQSMTLARVLHFFRWKLLQSTCHTSINHSNHRHIAALNLPALSKEHEQ